MLNSTEDAHTKCMSTFEADEHLRRFVVSLIWLPHFGYYHLFQS
jgi:hypothetical protein